MSERMLDVEELVVRYGRTTALRGVTLHVDEGEAIGVIGANGAGKTTLLSTVMGLAVPASGSILLAGDSIVGRAPEQIARLRLALVPEGRHIFTTLTVEENLLIGGSTWSRNDARSKIVEMYARFPILETYRSQPAGRLSGGEQQQLAIARALMIRPRLLLLDEPSLGLAPKVIDLVFDTLAELRSDGVTIVLVEQNARRTLEFADRTYVLSTGSVELESGRDGLAVSGSELERLYLGGGLQASGGHR